MVTPRTRKMAASKVVISIDNDLLAEVDRFVASDVFASRSQAFQAAMQEKLARLRRHRLAEDCGKLDPAEEKAMAEEGIAVKLAQCPSY